VTDENRVGYYDDLGDKFEAYMSDYDVERRRHLIFDTLIVPDILDGRSVLEVGSGTGRFSESVLQLGGNLTALDIGPGLVDDVVAKFHCAGVAGDACELPFRDESFEVVISSECIEHTLYPEQAIREMCRVCRPGGFVCLTTPNKLWYPVLVLSQKLRMRRFSGIEKWIFPHRAAAIMREEGMLDTRLAGCHLWPFQLKLTRPLLRKLDESGKWLYPLMINFGILSRK
jgi:ubiquinone/menaquinone biosynthesis C-methylase UbiE